MSEYSDSDESLDSADMAEVNEIDDQAFEQVEVKGVERSKQVKNVLVKKKPAEQPAEQPEEPVVQKEVKKKRELSEKQKENIKKLVERNKARAVERKRLREEGKPPLDEKPRGRKPKSPKKEVIVNKEVQKIIYMLPDGNGGFQKHLNPPRLSKKDLKYYENVAEAEKEELLVGKKLLKTKSGKVDQRKKERTEKQKAATLALIERNKAKREAKKKQTADLEQNKVEQIKDQVHNTIVEVVKTPREQIKKRESVTINKEEITEEMREAARMKKIKDLFS